MGARTQHREPSESSARERPAEVAYAESVRRFHAARQRELQWAWLRYHLAMQRANRHTLAILDAHHAAEIAKYERLLGITPETRNE